MRSRGLTRLLRGSQLTLPERTRDAYIVCREEGLPRAVSGPLAVGLALFLPDHNNARG